MQRVTVTYEDFDGNSVQEELFFNLSKAELIRMELDNPIPLSVMASRVQENPGGVDTYRFATYLITKAYGMRSEDGRRFHKTAEQTADFETSPAYDAILEKFMADTDFAAGFIGGILPKGLMDQAQDLIKANPGASIDELRALAGQQND